jgi:hypothetical protein
VENISLVEVYREKSKNKNERIVEKKMIEDEKKREEDRGKKENGVKEEN